MADQQFCLRWNNHQSTLISVFDTLLLNGTLVDCTLAAEGQYLKAHKVVLSACSPYLESLLSQHFEKHPIVILKDVKFSELKSMMDYMYRGEVNISQDQLGTFLKAAESLQIKGLSDNGADGDARDVGSTPKAPPPRKANVPAPSNRPEPVRPDSPLTDGSMSPSSRKRRRVRRSSQDDDNHLESNSCDLPSQAQSTPVPNIPASSSITTTPIVKPAIVKPEQTDVNRIDSNSLPLEVLKKEIEPISEPLIEPKTEYLEDVNNEDSVEDLTLDDDDDMEGMDISNMSNMSNMSRPGPSHGNDISNQSFTAWNLGANQSGTDEVFMAAQEAVNQHRDSQVGVTEFSPPDPDLWDPLSAILISIPSDPQTAGYQDDDLGLNLSSSDESDMPESNAKPSGIKLLKPAQKEATKTSEGELHVTQNLNVKFDKSKSYELNPPTESLSLERGDDSVVNSNTCFSGDLSKSSIESKISISEEVYENNTDMNPSTKEEFSQPCLEKTSPEDDRSLAIKNSDAFISSKSTSEFDNVQSSFNRPHMCDAITLEAPIKTLDSLSTETFDKSSIFSVKDNCPRQLKIVLEKCDANLKLYQSQPKSSTEPEPISTSDKLLVKKTEPELDNPKTSRGESSENDCSKNTTINATELEINSVSEKACKLPEVINDDHLEGIAIPAQESNSFEGEENEYCGGEGEMENQTDVSVTKQRMNYSLEEKENRSSESVIEKDYQQVVSDVVTEKLDLTGPQLCSSKVTSVEFDSQIRESIQPVSLCLGIYQRTSPIKVTENDNRGNKLDEKTQAFLKNLNLLEPIELNEALKDFKKSQKAKQNKLVVKFDSWNKSNKLSFVDGTIRQPVSHKAEKKRPLSLSPEDKTPKKNKFLESPTLVTSTPYQSITSVPVKREFVKTSEAAVAYQRRNGGASTSVKKSISDQTKRKDYITTKQNNDATLQFLRKLNITGKTLVELNIDVCPKQSIKRQSEKILGKQEDVVGESPERNSNVFDEDERKSLLRSNNCTETNSTVANLESQDSQNTSPLKNFPHRMTTSICERTIKAGTSSTTFIGLARQQTRPQKIKAPKITEKTNYSVKTPSFYARPDLTSIKKFKTDEDITDDKVLESTPDSPPRVATIVCPGEHNNEMKAVLNVPLVSDDHLIEDGGQNQIPKIKAIFNSNIKSSHIKPTQLRCEYCLKMFDSPLELKRHDDAVHSNNSLFFN